MSTSTPYLGLILYNADPPPSGDQAVTFSTFRAVWGGTATTSNFYKIDTAMSAFNTRITSLESNSGAVTVNALYVSPNYYEATGISAITAYNTGATIILSLDTTSDGSVTLNINSLGIKSVMKVDTTGTAVNLTGSDLIDGRKYMFVYDGTRWLWVGQTPEDDGWVSDGNTWTYSSADGSTGIVSVNANMTTSIQRGMRLSYVQSQALTAYWTFNTNSNSDVGSFNGTDTAMTYTAGKFSNGATFNGTTSKITFSDSASLKPTGEFTVGAWVKSSNTGAEKGIFQSYSANTNAAGILFRISVGNVIEAKIANNTGTTEGVNVFTITGTTNVCDGNWHYVVYTYRNNYAQLYVDGKQEGSGYAVVPAYAGTNYVRVGVKNVTGTDTSFMNGQIDDLFFINGYALDEKTIYDKYVADTAQGTGNISVNKKGIVTSMGVYSGGNTLITFWGGTDFSLANSAITSPRFSNEKVPFGFSTNPEKWSVLYTNTVNQVQASPAASTYYNLGSMSVSIPIGLWDVTLNVIGWLDITTQASLLCTLSTSTSSASDSSLSSYMVASGSSVVAGKMFPNGYLERLTKAN